MLFLAGERAGGIVATGALHASDGVVGISNVTGEAEGALRACVAAAREWRPGSPVVGYEGGAELEAARAAGFERLGSLRVWERAGAGA